MINKIVGFKVLILPLAAVFAVMMSVLYIMPAYDEMQASKLAQAEKRQQLVDLQKQNQKLAELKNKWATMESERSLIEGALPATSDMEKYLSELDGRVNRSGVLLSGVISDESGSAAGCSSVGLVASPAVVASSDMEASGSNAAVADGSLTPASQSCLKVVSIKLTASGSWEQMINFFKYLEDTNRIANITSISMTSSQPSSSDQQSTDALLNANVDLSVFYKVKSEMGSPSVIKSLTGGQGFEENVIKKLNEVVFSPYVAPAVSKSGERNIFK